MTPAEKAFWIFHEYRSIVSFAKSATAYHCSKMLVDEVIDALEEYDNRNKTNELQNMDRDFDYWQQVKFEIEQFKK